MSKKLSRPKPCHIAPTLEVAEKEHIVSEPPLPLYLPLIPGYPKLTQPFIFSLRPKPDQGRRETTSSHASNANTPMLSRASSTVTNKSERQYEELQNALQKYRVDKMKKDQENQEKRGENQYRMNRIVTYCRSSTYDDQTEERKMPLMGMGASQLIFHEDSIKNVLENTKLLTLNDFQEFTNQVTNLDKATASPGLSKRRSSKRTTLSGLDLLYSSASKSDKRAEKMSMACVNSGLLNNLCSATSSAAPSEIMSNTNSKLDLSTLKGDVVHRLKFNVTDKLKESGKIRQLDWFEKRLQECRESRFKIPMVLSKLETLTVMDYLLKYYIISPKRMVVYKKMYDRHRNKNTGILAVKAVETCLLKLTNQLVRSEELKKYLIFLDVTDTFDVTLNVFAAIAALAERLLYHSYLTPREARAPGVLKSVLEAADFGAMRQNIHFMKMDKKLRRLLLSLL